MSAAKKPDDAGNETKPAPKPEQKPKTPAVPPRDPQPWRR